MPSDVWSLGCMLMELYTGELLFRTVSCACLMHAVLLEGILRLERRAENPVAMRIYIRALSSAARELGALEPDAVLVG